MNKGELIQRLSGKLGDAKTSSQAVDALVSEIENAVSSGEKVNITGFGVFEKRERAARTGRNPRTGEPINVKKHVVPAFRPGQSFKVAVAGQGGRGQRGGQASRSHTAKAQSSYAASKSAYGQPSQTQRPQAKRAQPARAQSTRAQSTRAQSARAQAPRGQQRAQAGRSQTPRAQTQRQQSASVRRTPQGRASRSAM